MNDKKLIEDIKFYITYPSMIKPLELRDLLIRIRTALTKKVKNITQR